jgi:pentalenolactone synthase
MDQLPFPMADDPLALPPRFRELQANAPLSRVRTESGDEAWLACGYDIVKELAQSADLVSDSESHRAMRRVFSRAFSARRMAALEAKIGESIDEILGRVPKSSFDLHAELSAPLPVLAICDLFGAPRADYPLFRAWTEVMAGFGEVATSPMPPSTWREFRQYCAGLLEVKRRNPGEDLFTDLATTDGMSVDAAAGFALGLLFAGHDTTVSRIDIGTLYFLRNPIQRDKLVADVSLVRGAVEEIVRLSTGAAYTKLDIARTAARDIAVGSMVIRSGDAVLLAFGAANRDPAVFEAPDEFDITRSPNPHIGFGHGPRFCIGNNLARIELRAVFGRLFQRLPTLRLAVPENRLRFNVGKVTGGVESLPVTW